MQKAFCTQENYKIFKGENIIQNSLTVCGCDMETGKAFELD
jgi:hypothetical protein